MNNRIKEFRIAANMTQVELAKMVEVSSRTIISLETGKYNPSLTLAYRLAEIFHISIEELFCLKENFNLEKTHNE